MLKRIACIVIASAGLIACGSGDGDADLDSADNDTAGVTPGTSVPTDTIEQPTTTVGDDSVARPIGGTQRPIDRPKVTPEEEQRIDAWLTAYSDSLNDYGDPEGTMYAGGSPLFNESKGEAITKYEYIVVKHPERPWAQPLPTKPAAVKKDS